MAVETFKLRGGACKQNYAGVIDALAKAGLAGTQSGGIITVTRTDLANASALRRFEDLVKIARSAHAELEYVVSA